LTFRRNSGAQVIICVWGWIVVCTAQYSLSSRPPPEPNLYKTQDPYGLDAYFRSLYLLGFFIVDLVQPAVSIGSKKK
jgi:hypothetical protein